MIDAAPDLLQPIAAAALIWWLGAGLVLAVERMIPRLGGARFLVAGLGLGAAAWILAESLDGRSSYAAYLGFAGAVGVWAWHEIAFLSGWLTGPRRAPCPPDARGWRRFRLATETLIYHEVALAMTVLGLVWLSWGAANVTGAATFAALWTMRLSAKLNLFFGVPNLAAGKLPQPLSHMGSYFRRSRATPLLAGSVTAAAIAAAFAASGAFSSSATEFEIAASLLIATLLALAALEHIFMALPIEDTLFWRWAFGDEPDVKAPRAAAAAPRAPEAMPPVKRPSTSVGASKTRPLGAQPQSSISTTAAG